MSWCLEYVCECVFCWRVLCLCVSAMVHCHHEPAGDLAHWTHGSAAPRLPAKNPHQDYKGKDRKHPSCWENAQNSLSTNCANVSLSSCRKSTGTFACRVSSTQPSTARCTTRCATGWPWRRPLLRWGKEACRASPWRTAMRRMKRTTRARTLTLQPSLPPLNPHTTTPFHTFDFSLVTDACTNSDSHSRTSLSARNAYEGTINYKNSTYTEENKNKNVKK